MQEKTKEPNGFIRDFLSICQCALHTVYMGSVITVYIFVGKKDNVLADFYNLANREGVNFSVMSMIIGTIVKCRGEHVVVRPLALSTWSQYLQAND